MKKNEIWITVSLAVVIFFSETGIRKKCSGCFNFVFKFINLIEKKSFFSWFVIICIYIFCFLEQINKITLMTVTEAGYIHLQAKSAKSRLASVCYGDGLTWPKNNIDLEVEKGDSYKKQY